MKKQSDIDYSILNDAFIPERRIQVAHQIVSVLKDALKGKNIKKMKCLELGTSGGVIGNILADNFGQVIGIDVDKKAAKRLWKKYHKKNLILRLMSGMDIKYRDNFFDVVVTNQDYECVPDAKILINEIFRVLKPGGICFFGARNKLSIIEGQYGIPFLSWLPEKYARVYLKLLKKKNYYHADYKNYWELKALCKKFIIEDYTIRVLKNPSKFKFKKLEKYETYLKMIPDFLLEILKSLIPNYIWVLHKTV